MLSKQMDKHQKTIRSWWIFMFVATLGTISLSSVDGLRSFDKNNLGSKPKGTIKTIEVLEDRDLIDCVDFYKQPAFDNPLIKKIKMMPSSYPNSSNGTNNRQPRLIQTWKKYGECPEGTIPILRSRNINYTTHLESYDNGANLREYATVVYEANNCQGGKARLNVWNPDTYSGEFSLSQIWVVAGPASVRNTIEVGWHVYPDKYESPQTRLFTYYTPDGYRTKCYNLDCGGFVQINHDVVLGGPLPSVSVYNGDQIDRLISISRDHDQGDWWLLVDDIVVGFFSRQIFPLLGQGADSVAFGGEIVNQKNMGFHTSTQMGSGHFAAEGYKKACYISNIQVVNDAFEWVEPSLRIQALTRPECYNLISGPLLTNMGTHFYFGGPGYSRQCRK